MTSTLDNWHVPPGTIPLNFDFDTLGKNSHLPVLGFNDVKTSPTWQPQERPAKTYPVCQPQERPNVLPPKAHTTYQHIDGSNRQVPRADHQQPINRTQPGTTLQTALPARSFQFSTLGRSIPKKQWALEEPCEANRPDNNVTHIVRNALAFCAPEYPRDMLQTPKLSIQTENLENYHSQKMGSPRRPSSTPAALQNPQGNVMIGDDDEKWQENEIPEELGYIDMEEPEEIRNVVQESLDEHRALRASKMHTQAIVVRTTITMSTAGSRASTCNPLVESSVMSPNQSLELISSRERSDAENQALKSSSSISSSIGDQDLQNLRASPELLPTSSQESLGSSTGSNELRLRGKRGRRREGLFKILPGRVNRNYTKTNSIDGLPAVTITSECTSCFDDIPNQDAIQLLCRHHYCSPCFSQLVSTAILSEDTFPPKCCLQDIPRRILQSHVSSSELAAFDDKALEYAVPTGSRYYCGSQDCARWIDTRKARRSSGGLQCPHCRFKMCTSCRGAQHGRNQDCPQDFSLNAALEQAERAGWRRCYSCRTMVELNRGCRHITCKCRAEFCYTCGAEWRTCECTEADQMRREAEIAERLIRHEAETRAEEAEVRAAIAAVEEAELRVAAEREAEEQAAEEARQAEEAEEAIRFEYERVEGIHDYFLRLREEIQKIDLQQKQAIASRHELHDMPDIVRMQADLAADNIYKKRVRQIISERETILASNDKKTHELRHQHRAVLMDAVKRHGTDQDTVFLQPIHGPETRRGAITDKVLTALVAAQDFEIKTLQGQHEREIRKWRARGAAQLAEFDAIMREEQIRFEKLHRATADRVEAALAAAQDQIASDWRWYGVLVRARRALLEEDEARMVLSGADAPREKGK